MIFRGRPWTCCGWRPIQDLRLVCFQLCFFMTLHLRLIPSILHRQATWNLVHLDQYPINHLLFPHQRTSRLLTMLQLSPHHGVSHSRPSSLYHVGPSATTLSNSAKREPSPTASSVLLGVDTVHSSISPTICVEGFPANIQGQHDLIPVLHLVADPVRTTQRDAVHAVAQIC